MNSIKEQIETIFKKLPDQDNINDAKQELLLNSEEKYHDLLSEGKSKEEAREEIINGIGTYEEWRQIFSKGEIESQNEMSSKSNDENTSRFEMMKNLKVKTIVYDVNIIINDSIKKVEMSLNSSINDKLVIKDNGNELVVSSEYESRKKFFNFVFYRGEITIHIPKGLLLLLSSETISGRININSDSENSFDNLTLKTVSGSISLNNVSTSKASLNTVSGKVVFDNIISNHNIDINTTSGSISGNTLNTSALYLDSVSGKVRIDNLSVHDNSSINTVSGSVILSIPKDHLGFIVSKNSVVGKYHNNRSDKSGEVPLRFKSVSGSLTLNDYQ